MKYLINHDGFLVSPNGETNNHVKNVQVITGNDDYTVTDALYITQKESLLNVKRNAGIIGTKSKYRLRQPSVILTFIEEGTEKEWDVSLTFHKGHIFIDSSQASGGKDEWLPELRDRWEKLCEKNFKEIGDKGSCVIGACLKNGNGEELIYAHDVSPAQGSIVWEIGLEEMLKEFNEEFDTKVHYHWGMMD